MLIQSGLPSPPRSASRLETGPHLLNHARVAVCSFPLANSSFGSNKEAGLQPRFMIQLLALQLFSQVDPKELAPLSEQAFSPLSARGKSASALSRPLSNATPASPRRDSDSPCRFDSPDKYPRRLIGLRPPLRSKSTEGKHWASSETFCGERAPIVYGRLGAAFAGVRAKAMEGNQATRSNQPVVGQW